MTPSSFSDLENKVGQLQTKIESLETRISDLLGAFEAVQGAWKTLDFLSKLGKPILWLGAISTALYTFWTQNGPKH